MRCLKSQRQFVNWKDACRLWSARFYVRVRGHRQTANMRLTRSSTKAGIPLHIEREMVDSGTYSSVRMGDRVWFDRSSTSSCDMNAAFDRICRAQADNAVD